MIIEGQVVGSEVGGGATPFYPYEINQSLRFDTNSYLSRTSSTSDRRVMSFSFWVKRSALSVTQQLFTAWNGGSTESFLIRFLSGDQLDVVANIEGVSNIFNLRTERVFRDVSSWYHIVIAFDTEQPIAADRLKIYINGIQETQFSINNAVPLNDDLNWGTAGYTLLIGTQNGGSGYYNGYMSEVRFIDGQQLSASDFGELKENIWIPKEYTGSYGTNGFFLDFSNPGNIGNDASQIEGPNIVTNSTFDTDTTDWAGAFSGSLSSVGGNLRVTNGDVSTGAATYTLTGLNIGDQYRINVDFIKGTASGAFIRVGTAPNDTTYVSSSLLSGSQSTNYYFVAGATTAVITLISNDATAGAYSEWDNVTVVSADGNHWTPVNLAASDVVLDSPTNNFATWNAIDPYALTYIPTYSQGNLQTSASVRTYAVSTGAASTGTFYAEFTLTTQTVNSATPSVGVYRKSPSIHAVQYRATTGDSLNGATVAAYGASYTIGDVIGVAFDADTGDVEFFKNGTSQGVLNAPELINADVQFLTAYSGSLAVNATWIANFGQDSTFAGNTTAGGSTDANGRGDFKYEPPSGHLALCTANLPEPAIGPNIQTTTTADQYTTLLNNSLRFNDDDTAYLSRTPSVAGNRRTWTFSTWFKRSTSGAVQTLFGAHGNSVSTENDQGWTHVYINDDDTLRLGIWTSNMRQTSETFTDADRWYHVVVKLDTTQANFEDRVRIWVDGVESAYAATNVSAQNTEHAINRNDLEHQIGRQNYTTGTGPYPFDGYLAETYFLDGTAVSDPTTFGEFRYGKWVPKTPTGLTYGTNGFYLDYQQGTAEGFSAVTWRGNLQSGPQYIGGTGFQPDLIWAKQRENTNSHALIDSVRGPERGLSSDLTSAENTFNHVTSFKPDGFEIGTSAQVNGSGTYVAWCWDAGSGSPVSNTDGTITSTVKANAARGFSIISYTGNGVSGSTLGIGQTLNAGSLIITKTRTSSNNWRVHSDVLPSYGTLYLDDTSANVPSDTRKVQLDAGDNFVTLNSTSGNNANGASCIAYLWTSIPGYSSIGTYTGNNTTTQSITTGFKPAFIMFKSTSTTGSWIIYDNTRDAGDNNLRNNLLYPNLSNAEDADDANSFITLTDTGFILSGNTSNHPNFGTTQYIYMAFADTRTDAFWKDNSGNGHDWAHDSITASDVMEDVPTDNFATLDPLYSVGSSNLQEGNLKTYTGTTPARSKPSTFSVSSGKWYWEVLPISGDGGDDFHIGVGQSGYTSDTGPLGTLSTEYAYTNSGTFYNNSTTDTTPSTYTTGDIIGVGLDMDAGTIEWYKNGVSQGSTYTGLSGEFVALVSDGSSAFGSTYGFNFGQDATFAGTKAPETLWTDVNGQGEFFHRPPEGFLALSDNNINLKTVDTTTPVAKFPYSVSNSLRFNDDDSAYLSRTPASAGDRKTWTFSAWVKRGNLGRSPILGRYIDASNYFAFEFASDDTIYVQQRATGSVGTNGFLAQTTSVYRDVSSWYHIVLKVDTTRASGGVDNGLELYINGEEVIWSVSHYFQNTDAYWNVNTAQEIGKLSTNYFDGYLAETHFIDGQALGPESFGEFRNGNYTWVPKAYSGSYGTNGFYLDYADSANLGNDASVNTNNWTPVNLAATDQVIDSPTDGYATLESQANVTLSEGNLKSVCATTTSDLAYTNIPITSGKYYCEMVFTSLAVGASLVGVTNSSLTASAGIILSDGFLYNATATGTGISSYAVNDIIGITYDADNNQITFYKNGTLNGSVCDLSGEILSSNDVNFLLGSDQHTAYINTGSDATFANTDTGSLGPYSDDNGYGEFYYQPPTGFLALNDLNTNGTTVDNITYNFNQIRIGSSQNADDNFNTVLWTGNGATQSITGVGFQPDWLWIKNRSNTTGGGYSHALFDSIRGEGVNGFLLLQSNTTNTDIDGTNVGSLDIDGFTLGSNIGTNGSGDALVAWNWKASNATPVTNTDGTITSTVSTNVDAGFSIVGYTGTGVTATVGHGLSQAPEMIIVKSRGPTARSWGVYHEAIGPTGMVYLDLTNAVNTATFHWNDTAPTTSVYSLGNGTVTNSSENYIAYCFHSVEGFSKFGSYTGNGSADGSFIYTGFRPAYVMVKRAVGGTGDWLIYDNKRTTYNLSDKVLFADLSNSEATGSTAVIDIVSNGFKLRGSGSDVNSLGSTYIFAAFAEQPFKYSNAR